MIGPNGGRTRAIREAHSAIASYVGTHTNLIDEVTSCWDSAGLSVVRNEVRRAAGRVTRENFWVKAYCASTPGFILEALIYMAIAWLTLMPYSVLRHSKADLSLKSIPVSFLWVVSLVVSAVVVRLTFTANMGLSAHGPERTIREKLFIFAAWIIAVPACLAGVASLAIKDVGDATSGWFAVSIPIAVLALSLELLARPMLRFIVNAGLSRLTTGLAPMISCCSGCCELVHARRNGEANGMSLPGRDI